MSNQKITNEGQENKYFHIMLNMADDDLDVYEYRLLGHYIRVCGQSGTGRCWESTRTTANKCKMSVGKVSSVRKTLEDKGYIQLIDSHDHDKGDTLMVKVLDRWSENIERYAQSDNYQRSPHEHERSSGEHGRSPHETKNNHIRENKDKEITPLAPTGEGTETAISSDETVTKEPTPLDAMKVAVKKHLKQYSSSQQTAVAKILLSQHTGKKAELNLSRPITPDELECFVQWWDTTKRKDGQPITRPRNQDSIKSWVEQWLETISQQDTPVKDDYIVIGTEY